MVEEQLPKVFTFGVTVVAVAAAASLIVRFRRAHGVQRQQVKGWPTPPGWSCWHP
jgi:hypothetical protein